eukprot:NODE_3588_length_949_cov_41.213333_g3297_i0.p1 GENE.NODE_3588_length_949_cov_41.213333_g3297_i0~~NODE_3588_length_949_cov_41.213333_g3297_i0.p1  ORF type:complete len:104 (-),score=24.76 NODE_3588_length_949_cov_41.213333_g3297_i0:40-351(-)
MAYLVSVLMRELQLFKRPLEQQQQHHHQRVPFFLSPPPTSPPPPPTPSPSAAAASPSAAASPTRSSLKLISLPFLSLPLHCVHALPFQLLDVCVADDVAVMAL